MIDYLHTYSNTQRQFPDLAISRCLLYHARLAGPGDAEVTALPGRAGARVALHTRLKPGMAVPYQEAHENVPAELRDAFIRAGVRGWTIWRSGDELFHLIECEDYARLNAALETLPVNHAWQARMVEYLDVVHDDPRRGASKPLPVVWEL